MRAYLVGLLLAAVCIAAPCSATDTWEELMPGVQHLHRVTATPWDIHVVTIDLTNPRVKIRVGIKNDNDKPDGGETVRSICQRYNAVAGINCDFFAFTPDQWSDHRHIPQGHTMTDGLLMLPPGHTTPIVPDRTAIAFPADSSYASVNKFMSPSAWWWNVCAGGPRIIRNGVVGWEVEPNLPDQTSRQPRTGAAVTSNWHTLILATVDGRQSDSAGMTSNELGALLQEFGGYNGLGFDSGGSTTMVINGITANHPSDGSDRPIADCLMVLDKLRQGGVNVLYESDFENPPYVPGDLGGQDGWTGSGSVASGGRGGGRCACFGNASAYRNVSAGQVLGVQWFECWVKASSTDSNAHIYAGTSGCANVASAVQFVSGGQIQAYDTDELGNPVWTAIGTYAADTWCRIHIRLDYNIDRYQVFVNGALKLSGASFISPSASAGLQAIKFEEIGGASSFCVDDIYVGGAEPDFLRISPDSVAIVEGGRKQFRTSGGTPPVTWAVVDEKYPGGSPAPPGAVAQVSSTGLLTANAAGTCALRVLDSFGRVDRSGTITVVSRQPLYAVKACSGGTSVNVSGLIVSAVFDGFIYAQEPGKPSGIRIATTTAVAEGSEIWARGTVTTVAGERVVNATQLEVSP